MNDITTEDTCKTRTQNKYIITIIIQIQTPH